MIGATSATAISLVAGIGILAGCAKSPESIAPAYTSEMLYRDWTCEQLGRESMRLATALATASAQQEQARSNDIAGVILLGLPVASLSGDNIAPQIARLKGERDAVGRASNLNDCADALAAVESSAPGAASETAPLATGPVACGPPAKDAASRPELRAALIRHYKRNPVQRDFYGIAIERFSIENMKVVEATGNLLTIDVKYRAKKVHRGLAKVEACGSTYKVLSFS